MDTDHLPPLSPALLEHYIGIWAHSSSTMWERWVYQALRSRPVIDRHLAKCRAEVPTARNGYHHYLRAAFTREITRDAVTREEILDAYLLPGPGAVGSLPYSAQF